MSDKFRMFEYMKVNKTNKVTIRLTPKEHQELLEITEQTGTTMTKILRSALVEYKAKTINKNVKKRI